MKVLLRIYLQTLPIVAGALLVCLLLNRLLAYIFPNISELGEVIAAFGGGAFIALCIIVVIYYIQGE